MAGIAAGTAALAAAFRRRQRSRNTGTMYDDSRVSGHSEVDEEKYSDEGADRHKWGKRILEIAAVGGLAGLAKKYFDRRRDEREDDYESGYQPTQTGSMTEESYSRVDDRPSRPDRRQIPPRGGASSMSRSRSRSRSHSGSRSGSRSRSQSPASSYYNSSYMNDHEDNRRSHTFRDALAGAGIFAAAKKLFGNRKRNEQRRVDDVFRRDAEEERLARSHSRRYSGEGRKLKKPVYNPSEEVSSSDSSSHVPYKQRRFSGGRRQSDVRPMPPLQESSAPGLASGEMSGPPMPPPPPGAIPSSSHRYPSGYGGSPPSVRMQRPNDGKNVTLRRLTDEEAAAKRERKDTRRRRNSASSLSGNEGGSDRWRRVEELERRQDEQIRRERAAAASSNASRPPPVPVPPPMPQPPPVPSQTSLAYGPPGSFTSPTFTGTEASGDYAGNRRRRRAERARARHERQQNSVEFT